MIRTHVGGADTDKVLVSCGSTLPEGKSAGVMVDREICRAQERCSENRHIVGVDALHTIEQDLARGTMRTG